MSLEQIYDKIVQIIKEELDVDHEREFRLDSRLIEIGIDSIAFMTLLAYLEETFSFESAEDVLISTGFDTIMDLATYVQSQLG